MNEVSPPEIVGPEAARVSSTRAMPFHARPGLPGHDSALPYMAAPYEDAATSRRSFTLRDLLIQAFYNKRLIRNFLVAGVAIGLLAALFSHTQYTAQSLLLVFVGPESVAVQNPSGAGPAIVSVDGLKAVQSEIQILESDDVVRAAIRRVGPATLFPPVGRRRLFGLRAPAAATEQEEAAIRDFRGDLRVENDTGTNIVHVSFTHPDRALALQAAAALVDAYLDHRRTVYTSPAAASLQREITQYGDKLHAIEAKIETVRNQYGVLDITQDSALAANRLDGILQRENQVRERRMAVHAELLAAQGRLASQPQQVFDSREITNNTPNDNTRNTLLQLQQEREHMATQYTANWPALRELDRKIASVQAQLDAGAKGGYFTARSVRNPVVDQLSTRLASLQLEDQALGQQLVELGSQYDQAQRHVAELRTAQTQLDPLVRARAAAEEVYRQFSVRHAGEAFQDVAADNRNASVRVVQHASAPLVGRSMAVTYLAGGLLLGMMLAAFASVVATLLRQVYIMPSEAERDLDLPGVADFPGSAEDFTGPASRREVSNLAAYLLDVTVNGRTINAVQVVSAADADGKSALVRALATELAQGHGLRTLILDLHSDGRAEAHALGGADERRASVVDSAVPVVATGVPQLWVSVDAAGSSLGNARTLLTRSREMLDSLRQHFDIVLVIGPDDMSDYAARRLSGLVDANLLVIRSEHTRAPVAAQLRDAVLSAGGNLLGFAYTARKYHIPAGIYRWL